MTFSIFKNPFEKERKRKTDDAKLVGELLGPEEEAEMREALGDQSIKEEIKGDDAIRLSAEEEAEKKKVEEESPERRRDEYIKWAVGIGKDEDWVDETFTFNADGTVIVEDELKLSDVDVVIFPDGLKEIKKTLSLFNCDQVMLDTIPLKIGGNLEMPWCNITSLESLPKNIEIGESVVLTANKLENLKGLPDRINWALSLDHTDLQSLDDLPKEIGGSLMISMVSAEEIPTGLAIGEEVLINYDQTELIKDAKAKGYKVKITTM